QLCISFLLGICRSPSSPLFPYTTLFRSAVETLTVALGERSYPIHIGRGLLGQASLYGERAKQVLIVTNEVVAPLYLARVEQALRSEEHTSDSSHVKISYAVFCLQIKIDN